MKICKKNCFYSSNYYGYTRIEMVGSLREQISAHEIKVLIIQGNFTRIGKENLGMRHICRGPSHFVSKMGG